MNVALIRPDDTAGDSGDRLEAAAGALRRAGRSASPYALVAADPLAAGRRQLAGDVGRIATGGPGLLQQEAAEALAAWRSGRFELPDYYLVLEPLEPLQPLRPLGPRGSLQPLGPAVPWAPVPAAR